MRLISTQLSVQNDMISSDLTKKEIHLSQGTADNPQRKRRNNLQEKEYQPFHLAMMQSSLMIMPDMGERK